jgi:hypothetical protein
MQSEPRPRFAGKVEIRIDGERLPISNFVQRFTARIVEGILASLKGVPENYREVSLTIQRSDEKQDL